MKRTAVLVVVLAVLPAGAAWAQAIQNVVLRNSFNPIGAGARGLGMGGAFIAVADDGTAASFNPAGLSQLRRTELAVVGFGDQLRATLVVPKEEGVQTSSTTNRHGAPDFVGLAIPFEVGDHSLTIQASYQRSVDLFGKGKATVLQLFDLREIDPSLRGTGEIIADLTPEQSGAFHTVSLSAGYQLTSRFSFGASINYWLANWTARGEGSFRLRLRVPRAPRPIEVPLLDSTIDEDNSLRGLNLNAGFLLRYPKLSLGGILRLPFAGDYNLDESQAFTPFDSEANPLPPELRTFAVTSRFHFPQTAGVGIALHPVKHLTLAADYTRTRWSRTVIENVPGGALLTEQVRDAEGQPVETFTDLNFFDLLPASQTITKDTGQFRGGAEYLVVLKKVVMPLRAGLVRDRSPIVELGTGEGRRIKGFTVGTGINFTHLVFDVALEHLTSEGQVALRLAGGEPVRSTGGLPTETAKENRIVASLIYRFSAEDPLKRALRFLFVGEKEKEGN